MWAVSIVLSALLIGDARAQEAPIPVDPATPRPELSLNVLCANYRDVTTAMKFPQDAVERRVYNGTQSSTLSSTRTAVRVRLRSCANRIRPLVQPRSRALRGSSVGVWTSRRTFDCRSIFGVSGSPGPPSGALASTSPKGLILVAINDEPTGLRDDP